MKMYISQHTNSSDYLESKETINPSDQHIRSGHNWIRNCIGSVFIGLLSLIALFYPLGQADAADKFELYWSSNNLAEQTLYHLGRGLELPTRAGILSEYPVDATRRYLLTPQDRIGDAGDWTEYNQQILSVAENGVDRLICADTGQIQDTLFLASTYGNWYVGAPLLSGRVTVRGVWFCPNPYNMQDLTPGQKVQSRIKVVRQHFVNQLVTTSWRNVEEKYLTMTISRVDDLSIAWNLEADSQIIGDGDSTYGDRVGLVNGDQAPAGTEFRYASKELKYGESEIIGDTPNTREAVLGEDWPGWEKPSGDNLIYGTWYLSRDFDRFLFRPNTSAVNQLTAGETVVSTLTVSWVASYTESNLNQFPEQILATKQISAVIRGPNVELSIADPVNLVVEGESALFIVTADKYPNGGLAVTYEPFNFTGTFLDETDGASRESRTTTLFFSNNVANGTYSALLEIPTVRTPDAVQSRGVIGVRLIDSPSYRLNSSAIIATADVSDSTIPLLSIYDAADIRPGETAYFPVLSNIDPTQSISVVFSPYNETGNFLDTSGGFNAANRSMDLTFNRSGSSGNYIALLPVPTVTSSESSGSISVRLIDVLGQTPDYLVSRAQSEREANVRISGNPVPQLSITDISTPINEGETAVFEIEANSLPEQALNVSFVPVNLDGNYLEITDGESGVQRTVSLTFAQTDNGYTAILEVPTSQPNRIDEASGRISVELIENTGYSVSSVLFTGTAEVNDVDVPVLAIEQSGTTTVGQQAVFTVTSDIIPKGPLNVSYTPTNTIGETIDTAGGNSGTARTAELTFSQSQPHTAEISVPTVLSDRPGGEFTVTLAMDASTPSTYELANSVENQSATAVVRYPIPELSIRMVNQPVIEGGTVAFNISTDTNPLSQLDVLFAASNDTGNFIDESVYGGSASQGLIFELDGNTGIYMANLEIPTSEPNRIDEIDGEISVVLQESDDYTLNPVSVRGTATVLDADIPELSIFGGTRIEVGGAANFTVVSDILPIGALSVYHTAGNTVGQFLDPSVYTDGVSKSSTLTFTENESNGMFSANLAVPTVADPNLDSGVITVTLNADTAVPESYALNENNQVASISVGQFPIPVLSVIASDTRITEGETAVFTIAANMNPVRTMQILHSVSNVTGNFLDTADGDSGTIRTASLSFAQSADNGSHTATIEVSTLAPNGVDEDSGMISLALETSAEYAISDVNASATVDVLDAEVPRLSIETEEFVTVGESAAFTVTSDLLPWQALTVTYLPENTLGEFIDPSEGASGIARTSSLVFSQTSPYTATIQVPTRISNESTGEFTVTLLEDESEPATYALSDVLEDQSATASVVYPTPELAIIGIETPIMEGDTAYLRVSSSIAPLRQLKVRYITTNLTGNFIDEATESSNFSQNLDFFQDETSGLYTAILEIQTRNPNGFDEVNGVISIELADAEEYTLNTDSYQTTVAVLDVDTPALSITGGLEVKAGESAEYIIVSDIQPFEPLAVSYTPENSTGNFLDVTQNTPNVRNTSILDFAFDEESGLVKTVLSIPTANDPDFDSGLISVSLNEDAGIANSYTLDANNLAASTTIKGLPKPELSVYSVETEATEGETLQFVVTANVNPERDLPVLYSLSNQSGYYLDTSGGESDSIRNSILTFAQSANSTEYTAMISVPTNSPNGMDEESGVVSIVIAPSETYSVSASNGSASVNIADAEVPRLSINIAGSVLAGEDAVFTVTSDLLPWKPLLITFTPQNLIGEFIETSEGVSGATRTKELTFSDTPPFTSTIRIPTVESGELDGTFIVTLQEDASEPLSYALSNDVVDHSATATVYFSLPELSIHSIESSINEGDTAAFQLSTTDISMQQLVVSYLPSNTAGNFLKESLVGSQRTQSFEFTLDEETGQRVAILDIPTRAANGQDEINGAVSVELLPTGGYMLNAEHFKANVQVYDVDIPELSFSGDTAVYPGETANLKLASNIPPVGSLSVVYTPANTTGQFLDSSIINPNVRNTSILTFEWDEEIRSFAASLPLPTAVDPNLKEGEITVTLNDDTAQFATYRLANNDQSASVAVKASGIPELSVYSMAPEFMEGEVVQFKIESSVNPFGTLPIKFSASNITGLFLDTTDGSSDSQRNANLTFTQSSDGESYVTTLEVPTSVINGKDEENGTINVTLLESSSYTINPQFGSDTVTIVDADIPALSISPVTDSVDAGQVASFLVTSDILPLQQLVIAYVPTNDAGEFLDTSEGESGSTRTTSLQFIQNGEDGSITATIDIATRKIQSSANGSISVGLASSQDTPAPYTVDQQDSLVTINMVPTISIELETDSIAEGDNIVVYFTAFPAPTKRLWASIAVEGNGKISFFQVPRVVTFRAGQSNEKLVLKSFNNRKDESDNYVTIRLTKISDSSYQIAGGSDDSENSSLTVLVKNVPSNGNVKSKYSVVSSIVTEILTRKKYWDNSSESPEEGEPQKIEISITPETNEVAEGQPARFTIKSSQPAPQDVTIVLRLSEKGNFIRSDTTLKEVLKRNQNAKSIVVETIDDIIPEEDGQVILEITETSAYEISNNNIAVVNISDANDRQAERKLVNRINQEVLPLFFNSILATASMSASNRVKRAFSRMNNSKFESDFQQSFKGLLQESNEFLEDNSALWRSLLDDSSFALNFSEEDSAFIPTTVWALSDHGNVSEIDSASNSNLDGSIYSGQVGLETKSEEGVLIGLSTLVSKANVDHRSQELGKVSFNALSTSLHPYFGIQSNNERFNLHSTVGIGNGSVEVDQNDMMQNSLNTQYYNSATGVSQSLYSNDSILGGAVELSLAGETWHSGQIVKSESDPSENFNASSHHYNFILDGEHKSTLAGGEMLMSTASVGFGGHTTNNRTLLGVELNKSVKFDNVSGLRISSVANTLLSQESGINHTSNLTANFDLNDDKLGLISKNTLAWSHSEDEYNYNPEQDSIMGFNLFDTQREQMDSVSARVEIGYGFKVPDADYTVTPFSVFGFSTPQQREILLGLRLNQGPSMNVEFEGSIEHQNSEFNLANFKAVGNIKW